MRNAAFLLVAAVAVAVVVAEPQNFFRGFNNFFRGNGGGNGNRGQRNQRPNNNNGNGGGFRQNNVGGGGGGGGCRSGRSNHQYNGRNYLISWQASPNCKWTAGGAKAYCRSSGMRGISLDTQDKVNHFLGLIGGTKYFWTGGTVSLGRTKTVSWPNGISQNANSRHMPWSHTGGANRAQPDNREGDESCLAVLNNFYSDGVKYHDVSCHHKKPTICEQL